MLAAYDRTLPTAQRRVGNVKRRGEQTMAWTEVLPDLLLWRDSCNVYAVLGEDGTLIVDAGSGAWLREGAGQLPLPPRALALTHYFRDHSAGAAEAAASGIPVYVPHGERHLFSDPEQHFRRRETYIVYDNIWDLYAPARAVPVSGELRDYDDVTLAGIDLRVVPLPGATPTQIGLVLRTPRSGRLVAFSAETIHSPGRVPRLAPLQYDYLDLIGSVNVAFSADLLRRLEPELLLPSLGDPIVEAPDAALRELQDNLIDHADNRANERIGLTTVGHDEVRRLSDRVWGSTQGVAASHFIIGDSGRAVIIDYGYWHPVDSRTIEPGPPPMLFPRYPFPERRRPLLHSLAAMREQAGVEHYDAVITTHYHDDHVCGIPLLQRVMEVECWVPGNFARLLADPAGHRFPCTWPEPIRIDRTLPLDEPFEWDGIRWHFGPMSGHTRFSAVVGWEVDGLRFAHTGDQYGPINDRVRPSAWPTPALEPVYVYRNGAFLDSYRRSAQWLADFRPDIVVSGHWWPIETDDAYFETLTEYGREYEQRHRRLMPLGDSEPHFGLDSMAGWMWPYRAHVGEGEPIAFEVTIRNPLPTEATLDLRLTGPPGWEGSTASVRAPARAEVTAELTIQPDGPCRRQPVTVELHADGHPFGPVLEALVTVGGPVF